ncbi:SRPBCC domain-containing protein [Chitinimonas sp. BJYL2]|uniref:SRPBCC domain-containing protein n=1 Tax=Chitinimonas sp. BJYL2 TaxID=2976696 RepID=UPI0022B3A281|nr:SRPBCC domain-containing protein [Chitinimonas sp. BJYL2]
MHFDTRRDIPASPATVFAAFTDPARLARWWGPAGFSNTFSHCEFEPGGAWVYVMHGPDNKHYPNESRFAEIVLNERLVIQHVSQPRYRLTISLAPIDGGTGTQVRWVQVFDDPRVASGVAHIVAPANEQNLDRLTAEVLSPPA